MKRLISFILLYSSFICQNLNAQTIDSTCIQTNWIKIINEPLNSVLFNEDTSHIIKFNGVFRRIENLVLNDQLDIYNYKTDIQKWYKVPKIEFIIDEVNSDTIEVKYIANYFKVTPYGPSVSIKEYYYLKSTYPDSDINMVVANRHYLGERREIDEIHIKKERVYNSDNKEIEFLVSAIIFCVKDEFGEVKESFLVKMDDLKRLKDSFYNDWINIIENGNYFGDEFLQIYCNEKNEKYR